MTEFYPNDFIDVLEVALRTQLKNYVTNVLSELKFAKLKGLSDLCTRFVETNKCKQCGTLAHNFMLDYLMCEFLCFLRNFNENNICQLKKII